MTALPGDLLASAATTAGGLAIDAVEACQSGHLALPLGPRHADRRGRGGRGHRSGVFAAAEGREGQSSPPVGEGIVRSNQERGSIRTRGDPRDDGYRLLATETTAFVGVNVPP